MSHLRHGHDRRLTDGRGLLIAGGVDQGEDEPALLGGQVVEADDPLRAPPGPGRGGRATSPRRRGRRIKRHERVLSDLARVDCTHKAVTASAPA